MDRNYVSENQVVDRYLRDELTDEERDAFEEFYLSDQQTLAELELAEKLQLGLKDCAERGLLPTPARSGWLQRAVLSPQWAAAASVLLVFSLGYSGYLYRQTQGDAAIAATQLVPLYRYTEQTRGPGNGAAAEPVRVEPAAQGAWVVLLVDPGFEPYADYRVTILDTGSGAIVHQVEGLHPDYEDLLAVGVAGSALRPGRYELRVAGRDPAGAFAEVGRIPFEVP